MREEEFGYLLKAQAFVRLQVALEISIHISCFKKSETRITDDLLMGVGVVDKHLPFTVPIGDRYG